MSTINTPLRMKRSTLHKRLSRLAKSAIRKAATPLLPLVPDVDQERVSRPRTRYDAASRRRPSYG